MCFLEYFFHIDFVISLFLFLKDLGISILSCQKLPIAVRIWIQVHMLFEILSCLEIYIFLGHTFWVYT